MAESQDRGRRLLHRPGHWAYAVRCVDEDGEESIWTGWSIFDPATFMDEADARKFARMYASTLNGTLVKRWVPEPTEWEVVDG